MKCPKCQYIGFDSGARCRNCGYEFSLSPDGAGPSLDAIDLPIQDGSEPSGPLADFSLNSTPNLPLFTPNAGDRDAPLVAARATPRAPLSVRRPSPNAPRPRPKRDVPPPEPLLALDTADLSPAMRPVSRPRPVEEAPSEAALPANGTSVPAASTGARIGGAIVDVLLVGAIDLVVVYFTLRFCDLTFAQIFALPMAPLLAFFVLLNGGYLSTFVAANGQTIGKMAAGTRVVPADPAASANERVSFGQSIVRAAAYLVSVLPLGLGFLPALAGHDRRALHDRLADTRVVKA